MTFLLHFPLAKVLVQMMFHKTQELMKAGLLKALFCH